MTRINKISVIILFLVVRVPTLELLAQPPFERGDRSREMKQEGPSSGEVKEIHSDEIVVDLSGRTQTIRVLPDLKINKEIGRSIGDIKIGTNLLIVGRLDYGNRIKAMLIKILPEGAPATMPAGMEGRSGPVTGKVVQLTPIIKIDSMDGEKEVDVSDLKKVIEEVAADINEIRVGTKVRLLGYPGNILRVIIIPSQPEVASRDQELGSMNDSGNMSHLPMPTTPTVSLFKKEIMDRTKDSPFGFKDAVMPRMDLLSWYDDYGKAMNDLGVYWMEPAATFVFSWEQIQRKTPDGYTPFTWDRYDRLIRNAQAQNIHISSIISAREPLSTPVKRRAPSLPKDLAGYQNFVRAVVERYDGDGVGDMPGLLYPIKYWKIEDEAMAKIYFNGTGEDYARIVNVAYDAVKSADSSATVILSMIRGYDGYKDDNPKAFMEAFFKEFSRLSKARKWDIFDQHWMALDRNIPEGRQYLEIKKYMNEVVAASKRYGYEPAPFWAMEVAGVISPEMAHASDLFKRFIYAFSVGVKKMFWSGLAERPPHRSTERDDPLGKATLIDAQGNKKLVYYTFKKMVELLDGADLNNVQTTKEGSDVYMFRFMKNSKPVWVMWNDGKAAAKEKIAVEPGIPKMKVVEIVPAYESGQDVKDYATAFKSYWKSTQSGFFEIEVGSVPVVITVD